jgi:hypothetical protein
MTNLLEGQTIRLNAIHWSNLNHIADVKPIDDSDAPLPHRDSRSTKEAWRVISIRRVVAS